jgi:predicted NUDIX family NTP pyrophosphohydrolase
MGGPFWAVQDEGAWSVPKGVVEHGEFPIEAARREFTEETGLTLPGGPLIDLGIVQQSSRKDVHLWALEGDLDLTAFAPGTFEMEWPPKTGRKIQVAELDAIRWQSIDEARTRLVPGQHPFLERLEQLLAAG